MTDENILPPEHPPEAEPEASTGPANLFEVEESAPDGGTPEGPAPTPAELAEDAPPAPATAARMDEAEARREEAEDAIAEVDDGRPDPAANPDDAGGAAIAADRHARDGEDDDETGADAEPAPEDPDPTSEGDDDEPGPELVWYVLKVQSGREDTIRDALERRVKIEALEDYFGQIVVPKEKVTEIRNNKKRTVHRKSYPGYLMVHMELNEKTWFVVRETPGVGDFVGAHGTPTPMSQAEIDRILKPEEPEKPGEAAKVKIDLGRGDRVKIKEGPFENFEGTVEEVIEARGLVKVILIIFNRETPVDLEYWQVERV